MPDPLAISDPMADSRFLTALREIVGASNVKTADDAIPFLTDWRGRYSGRAVAVVLPGTTDEVAAVVRLCRSHGRSIVPQGGNTGLCGAATPDASGRSLVLCLRRMDAVLAVDTEDDTMTVQAGCTLAAAQTAAHEAGRLFPLSLGSQGTCTIGGNLATNAGGTQVLRYGTMRELSLGLEVVTAAGEIWHGLGGVRKDNTGYALRDLFIGSEGTLGIVTAATLKLFPRPVAQCTAWLPVDSIEAAVALLAHARRGFGSALTAFELIGDMCVDGVARAFPDLSVPFPPGTSPWYALLELSDSESEQHARERFEAVLGEALEQGLASDAVIAANLAHSAALWHVRESIPLAEATLGKAVKHDISVPVSRMAGFVASTNAAIQARFEGVRHVIFGHLGDGNLHYNIAPAIEGVEAEAALLAQQDAIQSLVHAAVVAHGGSISAEHGIGQLKRAALAQLKDPVGLALMHSIKQALDPEGRMNPGKVLETVDAP